MVHVVLAVDLTLSIGLLLSDNLAFMVWFPVGLRFIYHGGIISLVPVPTDSVVLPLSKVTSCLNSVLLCVVSGHLLLLDGFDLGRIVQHICGHCKGLAHFFKELSCYLDSHVS